MADEDAQAGEVQTEPTPIEGGWLIENGDVSAPHYFLVVNGVQQWTTMAKVALRFSRRSDAEGFAATIPSQMLMGPMRVAYHEWG